MLETITSQVKCEESSETYGKFVAEPLESGLGVTLGNTLRRVLLSLLPGAAVTAIKIEGVQHEFTTIPHVKEDVIEFLLNVKALRLRWFAGRSGKLQLEVQGEGAVTAADIKPSADFEVVNPELHLATLDSPDSKLNIELYVDIGKGYQPAVHGDGYPLGVIPLDAVFTPIRRVNYVVEKTRVAQVSNYDKLVLEVWTDGSISPREALSQAARTLMDQLNLFLELGMLPVEGRKPLPPSMSSEQSEMSVEQLGLSARTLNALRRSGITTVGELVTKSHEELLALRSFGQKSLDEVAERLAELDLLPDSLKADLEEEPEGGVGNETEEVQ